jgi:Fe-S cluster biogenesis protein NfuA
MERVLGDLRYAPRRLTMCEECGCSKTKTDQTFEEKVKMILDAIRPNLQNHGGDVEFVSTENGKTVKVRLQGACSGCPGAKMTLKMGIERLLKDKIPQVKEVIAVD